MDGRAEMRSAAECREQIAAAAPRAFASHVLPLDDAPHAYDVFEKKQDGAVKIMPRP
jgi:threonine dehydrogenase-like Zn-dependent dehydrogenase